MKRGAWEAAAAAFHERVKANCWDSLAGQLLVLHAPWVQDGSPVCQGCDRDSRETADAVWPCRTYTIIAATMLSTETMVIEEQLRRLLTLAERRTTRV